MKNSQDLILITALGYGAGWTGDATSTPWSVYLTPNGRPVLQGGSYPNDCEGSKLMVSDLKMEQAIQLADRLGTLFTDLGFACVTETIGDA